ncbi:MAG: transposase [Patescibacteria group bacterium]|jgi:putative transposase
MPSKNALKTYIENGFYHVYNRGVEKRNIFLGEQDYKVFLSYLKLYLTSKDDSVIEIKKRADLSEDQKNEKISKLMALKNYFNKIELLCYVLMPNHFHIEIRQKDKNDMERFLRSVITKYSKYFNKKYNRVGPLFQGRYNAVLITNERYLLHLGRYIHLNPQEIIANKLNLSSYPWSSYPAYVNNMSVSWLNKGYFLSDFEKNNGFSFNSYQDFVEGYREETFEEIKVYKKLFLD